MVTLVSSYFCYHKSELNCVAQDPCKGLGAWIALEADDPSVVYFVNYPDVPECAWRPLHAEANAKRRRNALEAIYSEVTYLGNVSKFLFPDGDVSSPFYISLVGVLMYAWKDPCKDYGSWFLAPGSIFTPRFEFKPDKHIPYAIWHPAWVLADNMFKHRTPRVREKALLRIFDEWCLSKFEKKFKPSVNVRRGIWRLIIKVVSRLMRRWYIRSKRTVS